MLKATGWHTIVVPSYVKRDGTVVQPHSKKVLYDPDKHDVAGVIYGTGGSHSHKQAHKKLHATVPGFGDKPVDEQFAHILSLATKLQVNASASAALSGYKASILAGKVPTSSQIGAWLKLSDEKQVALISEVAAKVGMEKFKALHNAAIEKAGNAGASAAAVPALPAAPEPKPETAPPKPVAQDEGGLKVYAGMIEQLKTTGQTETLQAIKEHAKPGTPLLLLAKQALRELMPKKPATKQQDADVAPSLPASIQDSVPKAVAAPGSPPAKIEPAGSSPVVEEAPAASAVKPKLAPHVVYENTSDGHSKFWSAHVDGSTLVVNFGKIGTKGQTQVKECGSPAGAHHKLDVLLNEKEKKGYQYKGTQWVTVQAKPAMASQSDLLAQWQEAVKAGKVPTNEQHAAFMSLPQKEKLAAMSPVAPHGASMMAALGQLLEAANRQYDAAHGSGAALALADAANAQAAASQASAASAVVAPVAQAPDGPKDGDTKQGADGVLVFKDGRWHKQKKTAKEQKAEALKAAIAAVPVPDFSGDPSAKWAGIYSQAASMIKGHLLGGGALTTFVITIGGGVSFAVKMPDGTKLSGINAGSNKPRRVLMHQFLTEIKTTLAQHKGATIGGGAKKTQAKVAQPTADVAPATPKPKVLFSAPPGGVALADEWQQIGPQKGSNPGGVFRDKSGQEWYVKFPATEDHAKNEVLASKLYKLAGVAVPTLRLVSRGGKVGVASKMIPGVVKVGAGIKDAPGALEGFGADAWLGNHDVVGMGHDNLLKTKEGKAIRIDVGGALLYRAQGAAKGTAFGTEVGETESLLDKKTNSYAASVFGGISEQKLVDSIAAVLEIPDDAIVKAVEKFGPGSAAEKKALADKLIARKQSLAKKFPAADLLANPPKPDPRHLPVDASQLPTVPDFLNWKGAGQGLSAVTAVNEANQKAVNEIVAAAMKGDFVALKSLKYHVVDKGTGAIKEGGQFGEHPSQHVRDFYSTVLDYLEVIANPASKKQKVWAIEEYSDIQELSDAFAAHYYGVSVGDVPASERLGFWISLGQADAASMFMPEQVQYAGVAEKKTGKASVQKLPAALRSFMQAVKSSGSANQPYRDGKEKDSHGNSCREVLAQAYAHAVEFPKGTRITKNISVKSEMLQQLLSLPAGHVFQNPGSMCCSIKPDWTGFAGNARLKIIYAEGAKGLYNIGVGSYDNEQEVTTLPGQRFMFMGKDTSGKPPEFTLLMLPPDPMYVENIYPKGGKP